MVSPKDQSKLEYMERIASWPLEKCRSATSDRDRRTSTTRTAFHMRWIDWLGGRLQDSSRLIR